MPDIQHKRGTRAALNTLATNNGLKIGQIYLITDEGRLAVATAGNAFSTFRREADEWFGSQAAYDALASKDPAVTYNTWT